MDTSHPFYSDSPSLLTRVCMCVHVYMCVFVSLCLCTCVVHVYVRVYTRVFSSAQRVGLWGYSHIIYISQ